MLVANLVHQKKNPTAVTSEVASFFFLSSPALFFRLGTKGRENNKGWACWKKPKA